MQSLAVGSFTEAQVRRAIAALDFTPRYRWRFEVLDRDYNILRALRHVDLSQGGVFHKSGTDTLRSCDLLVTEEDIDLDAYDVMLLAMEPLFYLKFGESSGTTASDASSNARHFTYNGGFTLQQAPLLLGLPATAGVKFNGSTGYASIADAGWMDVSRLTLCGWWKGTGTSQVLIDRDDGSGNRFFSAGINASGQPYLTLRFTSGSPNPKTFTATAAVNDGNPHFFVFTYDGANVQIDVDSVRLLRTAETRTLNTGTLGIRIGASNAGSGFSSGTFDEWAMFNRVLTAAEKRDLYQTGAADLSEIDYTRDLIKIWCGVAMQIDPDEDDDTQWAEWSQGIFEPVYPTRPQDETGITRRVVGNDYVLQRLKSDGPSARWTVAASENYITGANGVLAAAQAAGLNTTNWSVTATTSTVPSALGIDFKLDSSYLEIINDMLKQAGYRPLRSKEDGSAVIEPVVLPANRTVEDTLSTADDTGVISAEDLEETVDLDKSFNVVVYHTSNPDRGTFLQTEQVNTNLASPVNIYRRGRRRAPVIQLDATDSNALIVAAQNDLARFSALPKLVRVKTLARPFHQHEDCLQLILTGTSPTLNIDAKFIESEWRLPFNIGMDDSAYMEHLFNQALSV